MKRFSSAEATLKSATSTRNGASRQRVDQVVAEISQLRKRRKVPDDFLSAEAEQLVLTRAWLEPLDATVERVFYAALIFVRNKRLNTMTEKEIA